MALMGQMMSMPLLISSVIQHAAPPKISALRT